MSDIEKAFAFLHQNTPTWIKDVTEIEGKIVRMQEELAKMPLSKSLLKKRTGSVESIRDLDTPPLHYDDRDNSHTPYIALHPSRKRKTPTITSGDISAPPKFRSRMMVIVTYDGQIQKSFEGLVRAIGTGRNMLRKAKMAAKAEEMAALAAFEEDSDEEDPYAFVNSKIGYRNRTGLSSLRVKASTDGEVEVATPTVAPTEIFDVPDKALEFAQALCEKAAHQSLRDGDCRKELEGVKKHFQEIHDRAAVEVAKHLAKKQADEETKRIREEENRNLTEPMEAEPTPAVPDGKPAPAISAGAPPGGIDIEVDDEDDDMDFVMPPIRLTSRA